MNLKSLTWYISALVLVFYTVYQYADKSTVSEDQAFAVVGLWKRQEFARKLREDTFKKMHQIDLQSIAERAPQCSKQPVMYRLTRDSRHLSG